MSLLSFLGLDGRARSVSTTERLPVDIGQNVSVVIGAEVEVKNDSGSPVPVSGTALSSIAGLSIPAHDHIALSYTGTNLSGVQYRTGGASGTIVGTLTLAYSDSNLISVTKS